MLPIPPNYHPINVPYKPAQEQIVMPPIGYFFKPQEKCISFLDACKQYCEEIKRQKTQEAQINVLKNIMQNNKNCPQDLDMEGLSRMIIDVSDQTGIDPIMITCIAQQETNFNQAADTGSGKGIMQVVPITVEDMYVRPGIYCPEMKKLIKKYKTLENVFAQKDNNPDMNLGNFGEMLYEYGNHKNLFNAVKTDTYTALKVGTYSYIAKLHRAKSLTKNPDNYEKLALELYNTTELKKTYSNKVYQQVTKYRQMLSALDITV